MRVFSAKGIGPLLLAGWTAGVTVGLGLLWESGPQWALRHGAWEADRAGVSEDRPGRGEQSADAVAEQFWSVPLAGSAEAWQKWSDLRWQQWQQLGPEKQIEYLTALLELLESPAVQLVPAGRKEVARLLEQIYNHLAGKRSAAGWPLLAKVQQRRVALLGKEEPAALQAAATDPEKRVASAAGPKPSHGEVSPSSRKEVLAPAASDPRLAASPPQGAGPQQESSRAEIPRRLPRAVANQARQLSPQVAPPGGEGSSETMGKAPPEAAAKSPPGADSGTAPRPGGRVPLDGPVAGRPPAKAPLWRLWHQWYRAAGPERKQRLWSAIASADVPQAVKETLYELGSSPPARQAKALERLHVQLGAGARAWLWWAAESPHEQLRLTALSLLAAGSDPLQLRRVYRAARGDESPRVRQLARQIQSRLR